MMLRIIMSNDGMDFSACMDAAVYDAIRAYVADPASAKADIEADPETYGSVRSDITDENAVYLASMNVILSGMDEKAICDAYEAVCDASGDRIGYVLLDGSMLPLSYGDGDSFSTIGYFAGYNVDGYGAATQFYSYNTYYGSTVYTSAMYDTFLWKAMIGPSAADAGFSSSNSYLSALAYSDGTVKAIPGYGLAGFSVANWLVMYNAEDNATGTTDGWEYMDGWEAMEKQENEGGTINYLACYVMLEYTGVSEDTTVLTGQVQQSSGEAVSGATVSVYQYSDVYGDYVLYSETAVRGGAYSALVPNGDYRVDISIGDVLVDSFTSSAVQQVTEIPDAVATGEVQVNGEIYDAEDMMLTLSGGAEPEDVEVPITNGEIRIENVLPGTYSYILYGADGTSLGSGSVTIHPGDTTGIVIAPTTKKITATVEDVYDNVIDGTSYDEAPVVIATNTVTGAQFSTAIGEDGKAEINVIPGKYTVSLGNGLVSMTSNVQNANSSNRSVTMTAYESRTVSIDNAPEGVALAVYAGEFSTVSDVENGTFDVPVSIGTDAMSYSIYGVSGTSVYYAVYTGGDSVTLSEGEYSKVTGTLKDGEDGESGTIMFYDESGFTVKATTDKDGAFTALMPTGNYNVNAYNSGDRVYLGTAIVKGDTTELGDLATVDGRRVSATLRYDSATGDGNVNLPFVKGMITYTYQEKEYQVISMTNTSGVAYYYIPDGIEAVVSFNNADGTYSEDNRYFACENMTQDVSSGSSNTTRTVTIQYVGYTDKDQENVVKQQSVTLDYDAELDFYEGDEPITMEAGVAKDLCPGEYEITIDGATGYYFSGTVYLYPGQTEFVGLDVVEVVTANIQKNESDAISIETEGSYHAFDGGYYLETGYEYYITSTNRSDASDVKIAYGYVDLTGDSREAVTLDMKATQSVMEVTGYVGINADGTITVESGDVKRQFDVTDGAFTLRLPADMNDVTATVEVSATVASVEHWFTATEDLINMRDGCIRNISVLSSDAPADDSEEEDEPAFEVAIDSAEFVDGRATVQFTVTNNGKTDMTYAVSAGTAWSLDKGVTVTVPAGESKQSTATGYYDAATVAPGLDGVDLIVSDINGTNTVTEAITENSAPATGSEGMDILYAGDEGAANDRISASQYMYAVTFVNKDVYAKNVQIGFTAPTGWYATVMDADGTLVAEAGAEVTIYGLQTVTYYVALMQMGADPDEDGKVASSPVQGITVTISGDASSTKALEPQEISVTVDDSGVSGGDAIDERSGIPSGVWFLVAVIILMIIAAFWLASKRGVFARR